MSLTVSHSQTHRDKKMNLNWENNIPKQPVMTLYDGGEEEEKEEEDTDDDNDNSLV